MIMSPKMRRAWAITKLSLLGLVIAYALILIGLNWGAQVSPSVRLLFVRYDNPSLLVVVIVTAALAAAATLLFGTILRTLRQLQQSNLELEQAELKRDVRDVQQRQSQSQSQSDRVIYAPSESPSVASSPVPAPTVYTPKTVTATAETDAYAVAPEPADNPDTHRAVAHPHNNPPGV